LQAVSPMRALHVLGRTIFGAFFVYNGLNHFLNKEMMSRYAASKGVPNPEAAVQASGSLALAGGLSLLAGLKPRQGLLAIIAFLAPVSLQMHRFWDIDDPQQRAAEMVHFLKNVALIGAALALLGIEEPWPASVDMLRAPEEDLYIQIGGRELRRLPA
jgi:putative oxidoreductase